MAKGVTKTDLIKEELRKLDNATTHIPGRLVFQPEEVAAIKTYMVTITDNRIIELESELDELRAVAEKLASALAMREYEAGQGLLGPELRAYYNLTRPSPRATRQAEAA